MSIYEDGSYLRENPTWDVEDSPWKAGQVLKMLDRNQLHPRTVCEVGCGAGAILEELQKCMPPQTRFHGYEVSPQAHALCAPRANEHLRFTLGDFLAADEQYDLILLIDVIEHIEDYFTFLRRVHPRGQHTMLHIPLELTASAAARRGRFLHAREKAGHLHFFNRELALRNLRGVGFEILDEFFAPGGLVRPRRALSYLAWAPRRVLSAISDELCARLLGGLSLMVLCR